MKQHFENFYRNCGIGLAAGVLAATQAGAAVGPLGTVVVVNGDSWASMAVANEFIRLRGIPPNHVVTLRDVPGFDAVGVSVFRDSILQPVFDALDARGIRAQTHTIAYSTDLPYAVDVGAEAGAKERGKIFTTTASINGLTCLYERVLRKDSDYLRPDANRYARRSEALVGDTPWTAEDRAGLEAIERTMQAFAARQQEEQEAIADLPEEVRARKRRDRKQAMFREVLPMLEDLCARHPRAGQVQYNRACALAALGRADEAMEALRAAVAGGWYNREHTRRDDDLVSLRERKDFQALVAEMRPPRFRTQPAVGFDPAAGWDPAGAAGADGERYLLSMMLAYTAGRGTSVREALACLRRSAGADGTHPAGTVYFMENSDIRSQTRLWAFESAADELRSLGVAAEIVEGTLPKDRADVQGLVAGSASLDWKASGSTILPGAICEHLTSAGGVMRENSGQTPLSEFLRHGAAASSGTVAEPYAVQFKFPSPFMHVHYARGATVAEAFHLSVPGPYQLLIVGDPLCRPWARAPAVRLAGLAEHERVEGRRRLELSADVAPGAAVARYDVYVDGVKRGEAGRDGVYTLETENLRLGYHTLQVAAVLDSPLATVGLLRLPFAMAGPRGQDVTLVAAARAEWGGRVACRLAAAGAQRLEVTHNGRELGSVQGDSGAVEVDTAGLGPGPVALQPVALYNDGTRCAGAPVALEVGWPAPIPGVRDVRWEQLEEGVAVAVSGGPPVRVDDTRDGAWLKRAKGEDGEPCTVECFVRVPEEDLYQVQLASARRAEVTISGTALTGTGGEHWRYYPAQLAPGVHKLVVRLAPGKGRGHCAIRFGAQGTRTLSAKAGARCSLAQDGDPE